MSTKHHLTLTVGALHGLRANLSQPEYFTATDEIYRAGYINESVLPDPGTYGEPPGEQATPGDWKRWADQPVEVDLTEKQRELCKQTLKKACEKSRVLPGKHTNCLLRELGLAPKDEE
jgi:hypothetical protein